MDKLIAHTYPFKSVLILAFRNYEECLSNVEDTRSYYESEYNMHVPNSAIQYKSGSPQVPNFMKNPVKKLLAKIFPGLF